MLAILVLLAAPYDADVAARIVGSALAEGVAYRRLEELTDTIGPRLAGSTGDRLAVRWAFEKMKADGLAARLEPVRVPRWERGEERAWIVGGAGQRLAVTALGGSAPTPEGGLEAELVVVRSLEELTERVKGRIVLFDHSMPRGGGYGKFAKLRTEGPAAASKSGAAAALVRSLATSSMRSPHTGATDFTKAPPIPAAAVSVEDAQLLVRLAARGPVRVRLVLGCRTLPDAESHNVVGEVRGRDQPEEIVLFGAHLDSWDLGTGAIDDGAGVVMAMEVGRLIARSRPRRTVRIVLFANEENGLRGAQAYASAHAAALASHVAAIEADHGAGRALGVTAEGKFLEAWLPPLAALGVAQAISGGSRGGADLSPMKPARVPFVTVEQDGARYFDWHHSAADTFDKVDPVELAQATAAYAWVVFALAEAEETLPRVVAP